MYNEGEFMYKLYFCDINLITDDEFEREMKALPLLRRREILRKKIVEQQKLSLAGDVLAKRAILELSNGRETPMFAKGENGKPYCINYPYHFNISHSKQYTVVAVSDRPIGVDIEVIRPFSASASAKYLTEDEKNYIVLDDIPENRNQRFYKLWCAKEAYLKLIGTGLKGGIKTLSITPKDNKFYNNQNVTIKYSNELPDCITCVVYENK